MSIVIFPYRFVPVPGRINGKLAPGDRHRGKVHQVMKSKILRSKGRRYLESTSRYKKPSGRLGQWLNLIFPRKCWSHSKIAIIYHIMRSTRHN